MNGECTVSNQEILQGLKNRLGQIQGQYAASSNLPVYQQAVSAVEKAIDFHESPGNKSLADIISHSEEVDYLFKRLVKAASK